MNSEKVKKIKLAIYTLLVMVLYFLTFEIIIRRLVFHQIPTPVSSLVVYALLAVNLGLIPYFIKPLVGGRKLGKN